MSRHCKLRLYINVTALKAFSNLYVSSWRLILHKSKLDRIMSKARFLISSLCCVLPRTR